MPGRSFYDLHYREMTDSVRKYRALCGLVKAENVISTVKHLPVQTLQYVLDIGCGTGDVLVHLVRRGFARHYVGIDISEECLLQLNKREDLNSVRAILYDGLNVPFRDQQFDLAILSHVVEHVPKPEYLLLEAARVARYLVIEVPLEANLHIRLKTSILRSNYRQRIGHVQQFSMRSFRDLLEQVCGFKIVTMHLVPVPSWLYFVRKNTSPRLMVSLEVFLRKLFQALPGHLYTKCVTDHCIALVQSPADGNSSASV